MGRDMNGSEFITLRKTNIGYVSAMTGYSKGDLKLMLKAAEKDGRDYIRIPVGVKVFTREER